MSGFIGVQDEEDEDADEGGVDTSGNVMTGAADEGGEEEVSPTLRALPLDEVLKFPLCVRLQEECTTQVSWPFERRSWLAQGEEGLHPQDIDAYWLQRRVGKAFEDAGTPIDADKSQELANEVFGILQVQLVQAEAQTLLLGRR